MHSRGYAHMDIKPHNVLIRRPSSNSSGNRNGSSRPLRQQLPRPPSARQMVMTAADGEDGLGDDGDDEGDEAQGLAGDVEAGRSLVSAACHSPWFTAMLWYVTGVAKRLWWQGSCVGSSSPGLLLPARRL
jgi:serine/threonine protein kinase